MRRKFAAVVGAPVSLNRAAMAASPLLALLILLVGNAAPAAAAPAPAGVSAVPAAAADSAPTHQGHERFRLTTHRATSHRQMLTASGVLNARGHAIVGRLVNGHGTDSLVFPGGSIRMAIAVIAFQDPPPSSTCRFTEVVLGTYRIRGGTRRYAGASGSGSYVSKIIGRLVRKHGQCGSQIASFWQSTVTSGSLRW